MTENFATTVIVRSDETGPAGLVDGPFMVGSSRFLLGREALQTFEKRDFWRAVTIAHPVVNQFTAGWEIDVGDSDTAEIVFDALADPTRGTDASGIRTWKIGRPDDVRRFDFIIDPVEGGHFELREAALASAQLTAERGRIATLTSRWFGRLLTTEDSEPVSTNLDNTRFAAAPTIEVEIDDAPFRVFSLALAITREIEPAQFDVDNRAHQWAGRQAVDILGRMTCRFDDSDFSEMMLGGVLEASMLIRLTSGDRVREIEMPAVRMEIGERNFISAGTYEHLIEFAVVRTEGEEIATITSTEI